jgi:hypothetical protein
MGRRLDWVGRILYVLQLIATAGMIYGVYDVWQDSRRFDAIQVEAARRQEQEREVAAAATSECEARASLCEARYGWISADVEAAHLRVENLLFAMRALAATQGCRFRLPEMPYRVERPMACYGWDHRWQEPVGDGQCYGDLQ